MNAVVSAGSSPLAYRECCVVYVRIVQKKKRRSESDVKTNLKTAPTETQLSPETGDSHCS